MWIAAREMWLAVDLDPKSPPARPSPWQPVAQGLTERALFTAAILTGNAAFIPVWIGIKTVAQWKTWGEGQAGTKTGRVVSGREVYAISSSARPSPSCSPAAVRTSLGFS